MKARKLNNKRIFLFVILCFITVSTTILNWGNRKVIPQLNDQIIQYEFPTSMTKVGNSTTIWVDSNKFTSEKRLAPSIIAIQGDVDVSYISRSSTKHEYLINVLSDKADIKENTLYFPGWIVKVDNNPYSFNYANPSYPGLITFSLNKGFYVVEIIFTNTFVRIFSMLLSGLTFLGIFIYIFIFKKLNFPKS